MAFGDADGDGFIDLHEYYALTDPTDSTDVFEIDSLALAATNTGQTVASWYGAAGRLYSVLSAASMVNLGWITNAYQLPGQDATLSCTSAPAFGTTFYRLKVELDN